MSLACIFQLQLNMFSLMLKVILLYPVSEKKKKKLCMKQRYPGDIQWINELISLCMNQFETFQTEILSSFIPVSKRTLVR